jgi:pyruvate/2-oxoacid:ferredoxin oxidoreductase alpha subunit
MKEVMTGNEAASVGASLARVQVVSAYPITPQTTIIETVADLVSSGKLKAKYIPVESEHSAMAGCIGAAFTGARTFTATSSQGLLLMHELLHWAGMARLPIVLVNVNRAVAPGWSIWTDQNDSLSQRDTGWMQFYCENNQEVLDTIIQSYKIAEKVNLPVMVVLDAFVLSHTSEIVDVPDQKLVDEFLPQRKSAFKLDVDKPCAFGGLIGPDVYQEFRYNGCKAMDEAMKVAVEVDEEWGRKFGRNYPIVDSYRADDADIVIVATATVASTARSVIDKLRLQGKRVGLVKPRLFRPFPYEEIRKALTGISKVAVIDRNISPGHHGIFHQEIKSSMYNANISNRPYIVGFVAGLGGRDVTPETINEVFNRIEKWSDKEADFQWVDLKV